MTSTSGPSLEDTLFACLCPDQGRYGPQHAALLASRLREVAQSLDSAGNRDVEEPAPKKPRNEARNRARADLDFSAYQQRYVALELLYLGHNYAGFARQETTQETIEGHLFAALRTTRLVPADASWQELRYSRGGRTDKGVSALGQVVALLLRSSGRSGGAPPAPAAELDYPALLNRVLPPDIRVLGWADAPQDFSARFSAKYREYKYLIAYTPQPAAARAGGQPPRDAAGGEQQEGHAAAAAADNSAAPAAAVEGAGPGQGDMQGPPLDVARMREAAAAFLGEHDFRNFCKMDVAQVTNFRRKVLDIRLEEVSGCGWGGRRLLQLHLRGTAFLWHQVRCMAAVLLMVGRGEEAPSVVATLLDTARTPQKPQYPMASEEPLLLYACAYGGLRFRRSRQNYRLVRGQLEEMLTSHLIRAGTLHTIQQRLAEDQLEGGAAGGGRRQRGDGGGGGGPRHIPLLLRAKEPAVEERLLKLAAARREPAAAGAAVERPAHQGRQEAAE